MHVYVLMPVAFAQLQPQCHVEKSFLKLFCNTMPIVSHIDVDALNDVKLANDAIVLTSSSNAMHHYVSSNQSDKR